ncbi:MULTISPECIES: nitroreductase family protein [Pseudoalteromonas]|uniref:nitroreductase family protein n=1 Tax=Pseudoalteromonas TaxID=53246 RepID=UPI00158321B6|nr:MULTISPECIES: nitroreductase family protein [Pseudoalteromonas]MDI4652089.1 nitroreductase family protein [Pseudoalteromonas shioyasakiensis]NUJ38414.1 nitroreductase family protein [Pseudoalteromonas sp. 0303]
MKHKLSKLKSTCKRFILNVCSFNFVLAKFYFLFSRSYTFEQTALLSGLRRFNLIAKKKKQSNSLLRRNIHRLEKGLIMQPRKPEFATDYIEETVETFKGCSSSSQSATSELDWAFSVLTEYFRVVKLDHRKIQSSLKLFQSINYLPKSSSKIPYLHKAKPDLEHRSEFEELVYKRASVRWFEKNSSPSIDIVKRVVDISLQAPSACNRQSFEYRFVDNKDLLAKLLKLPGGVTGFADNIPSLMVVIGDYSGYYLERDRHLIYIDASLSSMMLLLAFENFGFNTCVLNWPENDKKNKEINSILNLPTYKRVIMLVAVGKADCSGGVPYSQKKDSSTSLTVNE